MLVTQEAITRKILDFIEWLAADQVVEIVLGIVPKGNKPSGDRQARRLYYSDGESCIVDFPPFEIWYRKFLTPPQNAAANSRRKREDEDTGGAGFPQRQIFPDAA